jgi:hypothetical protein
MATKTKRTYNLSDRTVSRVRELAERYGAAPSQDGVVELAIERLYRDVRDREEAGLWAAASEDPEFHAEMRSIAGEYGRLEPWPE